MTHRLIRKDVTGTAICIPGNDIDTDQITPARFLKEITFENMGVYLFYDARFDAHSHPKAHILNTPEAEEAKILIVGKNFGCGSSREHAPQSIMRFGFQAIVGESFAEIFAGNCKSLGVPCVKASPADLVTLREYVVKNPGAHLHLDIERLQLSGPDFSIPVALSADTQKALLSGEWNARALLKESMDKIKQTAERLPYIRSFQ